MKRRELMWMSSSFNGCFSRIHFFLLLHLVVVNDVRASVKDEVETVEVTEGTTVTLRTHLTGIKSDDMIRWTFGTTDTRIAQLVNSGTLTDYEERFGDRLQLDTQTGSLTISNIRSTDSGVYKVQIISKEISSKHFSVTVYATVPVPSITPRSSESRTDLKSSSRRCSVVCSVRNAYKVTLSWHNGSDLHSISDSGNSTLSLPLDFEHGDNNTYSCVAANPVSNQTVYLNTTCTQFYSSKGGYRFVLWLIPVLILLLLVLVATYLLCRKKKVPKNRQEGMYLQTSTISIFKVIFSLKYVFLGVQEITLK
uniref:Ig-like domain-containing protein n=1 Tax=Pygocentrus nattereri TaxID=42514 RepID=A0AAR2JQ73_PYGNA